jgi:hypothetical protein
MLPRQEVATMKQYTISMDEATYGEGITFREMCAIAEAEAEAIRSRFPGTEVHTIAGPVSCAGNDPDIAMFSEVVWNRIMTEYDGNGCDPAFAVAAWQREAAKEDPRD